MANPTTHYSRPHRTARNGNLPMRAPLLIKQLLVKQLLPVQLPLVVAP